LKRIVDTWLNNRRNNKPWEGPLPPPRKSPPRTLGDAMAQAKIKVRSPRSKPTSDKNVQRNRDLPETSSDRKRQTPLTAVIPAGSARFDRAASQEVSNPDGITENSKNSDSLDHTGRHGKTMGLGRLSKQPNLKYNPTPGLIALFARIGTRHRNPKPVGTTPPPSTRRSYVEVLRTGMANNGAPFRAGAGQRGYPNGGPRGSGQADAFARGGFQRGYPAQGGGGFYGGRGGGRWQENRDRGYGGHYRHQQSFNGHRTQHEAPRQNPTAPSNGSQIPVGGGEVRAAQIPNPPGAQQGDVSATNQLGGIGGSQPSVGPQLAMMDISSLPVEAVALLQQMVATIANKGSASEVIHQVETAKKKEKETAQKES
jgi:hypothetical protein